MLNTDLENEHEIKKRIHDNLAKKGLDPCSSSYDTWIFENYTKERLKSLGVIH